MIYRILFSVSLVPEANLGGGATECDDLNLCRYVHSILTLIWLLDVALR